ncbi:phage tail protein [Pedobacter chitinilyticus]|uniref:Phage tail protein n=1 Tax=Pedobacter chitinilyticus TaxID=2233776 RepID=A0A443YVB7_9SPHI|nr:tail fiber protein [Pedobacter chitinilyticus]RWU07810.1 phage tail protein [Pedobacter chitinilyticus]
MQDGTISEIRMFAADFEPKYWAFCRGQLLSINQNQALFALLGTTFGGNGTTNFALPDLRSRVAIGTGIGGNGVSNWVAGQIGGAETHMLVSNEMPQHTHASNLSGSGKLSVSSAAASLTTPVTGSTIASPIKATGRSSTQLLGFNNSQPNVALSSASLNGQLTVTNAVTGSNTAHSNMQPYLGMNYIICMMGIFPSRN